MDLLQTSLKGVWSKVEVHKFRKAEGVVGVQRSIRVESCVSSNFRWIRERRKTVLWFTQLSPSTIQRVISKDVTLSIFVELMYTFTDTSCSDVGYFRFDVRHRDWVKEDGPIVVYVHRWGFHRPYSLSCHFFQRTLFSDRK